MRLLAAGLLLVAPLCAAFYLPGLAPVSFCEEGEESEGCKVRALTGGPDTGRPPPSPRKPRAGQAAGLSAARGGTAEYPPSRCVRAPGVLPQAASFAPGSQPLPAPFPLVHPVVFYGENVPFSC